MFGLVENVLDGFEQTDSKHLHQKDAQHVLYRIRKEQHAHQFEPTHTVQAGWLWWFVFFHYYDYYYCYCYYVIIVCILLSFFFMGSAFLYIWESQTSASGESHQPILVSGDRGFWRPPCQAPKLPVGHIGLDYPNSHLPSSWTWICLERPIVVIDPEFGPFGPSTPVNK